MGENSRQYSKQLLLAALAQSRGNYSKAAKLLQMSRAQFYKLAKLHGLNGESSDSGSQPDPGTEQSDWLQ
jgi:DNA-binding NtrC family response regulator